MKRPHVKIGPWVWLRRFRKRRGYGVHSPFAFNYITRVCNETAPYYKYQELKDMEKALRPSKSKEWGKAETMKLKRLLFRMVNRAQPQVLVETGPDTAATLYLQAAKQQMKVIHLHGAEDLKLVDGQVTDFLYLRLGDISFMHQAFEACLANASRQLVVAVQGIHKGKPLQELWRELKSSAVITFDLYDIGILFFDETYFKQDYIVNF